jgi:VWFA-related protein
MIIGTALPAVIWTDGDQINKWVPNNPVRRVIDFDTAMASLSQMSGGGSLLVPPLLAPNLYRLSDLLSLISDPKVTGEEQIDGRLAFKIEGLIATLPVKLWIDKNDYLILKTYRVFEFGKRQIASTILYKPKLNSGISPQDLVFKPPENTPPPAVDTDSPISAPLQPPALAPRLREFGFSLKRNRNAKAADSGDRTAGDDDVVRVDTDLVLSAVLVVDPQGKMVTGLTKDDFIVKEDDKLQEIASLSMGDSKDFPRSIVLIIDYSRSQLPYIRNSIESAKMLVDKLNPKDRMALVTDDVKLLSGFTGNKQLLKEKLEGLKRSALSGALGASQQYDALMATLNEVFNVEDVRPIIVFQTDGDQLEALRDQATILTSFVPPRKYGLADILARSNKIRATVYSVISGVRFAGVPDADLMNRAKLDWGNRNTANMELARARNGVGREAPEPSQESLQRIAAEWVRRQTALISVAKSTGAWAEFLEQPEQADEIYTRILSDIERRYVIGYYPTNRKRDGKFRKVTVEVRGHPEYSVQGQKSYFGREEK